MKLSPIIAIFFASYLFVGCVGTNQPNSSNQSFSPVYMQRTAFENSISVINPKPSINAGKIYLKDNLLYINDVNKGFQVYNYSNPSNPEAVAYINFPGTTDMAIRNNTIHVNQATDLVSIDYNSTTNTISVTNRIKNTFPVKLSPNGNFPQEKANQVVVNWILNQ